MAFIKDLIEQGWLKTPRIIKAFSKIKRKDFVLLDMRDLAEVNRVLPIGFEQTISQPLVVAFMLELLQPKTGEKILDIGSGSGWTTALLSELVGLQGKVIAMERIAELKEFGQQNVKKYSFIDKGVAMFILADGSKGYKQEAPFDKILVSASADKLPSAWQEQLKIGGKIVAPIKNSIWLIEKKSEKEFKKTEFPNFVFVPLI